MNEWKAEVESTITCLEGDKPSPQNAILLNALYGLRDHWQENAESMPSQAVSKAVEAGGGIDYAGHIRDELTGAEAYLRLWEGTGESDYKDMAQDELRHAMFWVQRARATGSVPVAELQTSLTWHHLIAEKLG